MDQQNGIIVGYSVHLLEIATGTERDVEISGPQTDVFITQLHPHYVYQLSVAALTVSIGPYSPVNIVQMAEDSKLKWLLFILLTKCFNVFSSKWSPSQSHC